MGKSSVVLPPMLVAAVVDNAHDSARGLAVSIGQKKNSVAGGKCPVLLGIEIIPFIRVYWRNPKGMVSVDFRGQIDKFLKISPRRGLSYLYGHDVPRSSPADSVR